MKLSRYAQNLEAVEEGVLIDLGEGCKIRIAKEGNERYQKFMVKALKPYQKQIRLKTMPDEVFEPIYYQAIAETVLLGWTGLKDDEGNEIPYSVEKVVEILSNKVYEEFKKLVLELASESAVFAAASTEDTKSSA